MQLTPPPHTVLIPVETRIVVANVLPSGAAFAVRVDNGDNCYIPSTVSSIVDAYIGMEVMARLVPNRFDDKRDKTPWLVVFMQEVSSNVASANAAVQYSMPFDAFEDEAFSLPVSPTTYDLVFSVIRQGGVWTLKSMFDDVSAAEVRNSRIHTYDAVAAALRKLFEDGKCSKFALWKRAGNTAPTREWFTCFPDRADVDEWDEN